MSDLIMKLLKHFSSPHETITLAVFTSYIGWRYITHASHPWSVLLLALIAAAMRLVSGGISDKTVAQWRFLLRIGLCVDSGLVMRECTLSWALIAGFMCLWLTCESTSTPLKSSVELMSSVSEWETATKRKSLIFFCDPRLSSCVQFSPKFAELSQTKNSVISYYLVDIGDSGEVAQKAKVHVVSQPVLVMYEKGKESKRIPTDSTKDKKGVVDKQAPLSKYYTLKAIRTEFGI